MRNDHQQIHIAALMRVSVGMGAEEKDLARMKAPNDALNKLLKLQRVCGRHGAIHYDLRCCGSQSVARPGTLYS